ncbi:MAG: phage protein gp10 family [Alphaproteobacteria bacterium]|jgi:HK97 gp10 family phage protein|nr:phage protein gp10 family [Alphaproteobacteria bacterium]
MADELIEGLGDLRETFVKVSDEMKDRVALRMAAAAGSVLKKESRRIAQSEGLRKTGALINNIVIKREKNVPEGTAQYHLGVRHGRGLGNGKKIIKYLAVNKAGRIVVRRQNDPYYWRFVEFGHKIVPPASGKEGVIESYYTRTTKNGKVRTVLRQVQADGISIRRRSPTGFVDPIPFIEPALENKKDEAIAAMEAKLKKELDKLSK